jgi:hypothetical protein
MLHDRRRPHDRTGLYPPTVEDTTAPAISGTPGDQTLAATSAAGAFYSFAAPTAADAVDVTDRVLCDHDPAGSHLSGRDCNRHGGGRVLVTSHVLRHRGDLGSTGDCEQLSVT